MKIKAPFKVHKTEFCGLRIYDSHGRFVAWTTHRVTAIYEPLRVVPECTVRAVLDGNCVDRLIIRNARKEQAQ